MSAIDRNPDPDGARGPGSRAAPTGEAAVTRKEAGANRDSRLDYSQLIRLQERILTHLRRISDELQAPTTERLIAGAATEAGSSAEASLEEVSTHVEQAIRALKVWEAEISRNLRDPPGNLTVEGIPNLPARLARFLAERAQLPGFSCEVGQDPDRGWVIRWREYTTDGTIRGFGQLFERPYAWLDD